MLLGSGGVIALVVGAWGVLWAIRATPGRPPAAWAPQLVALAGLAAGAALLSAHTTLALGVQAFDQAQPSAQATAAAVALSRSLRPLIGALLGLCAIGATIAATRSLQPPAPQPPAPSRAQQLLSGAVVVACGLGGVTYALLRATAASAMADPAATASAAARLGALTAAGVGASALVGILALILGAWCARSATSAR